MAQLAVTITDGDNTQYYEVSEETTLEDLKCIVLADFGKAGDDVNTIEIVKEKRPLQGQTAALKTLGVLNGDLLFYWRKKATAPVGQSSRAVPPPANTFAQPTADPGLQARMAELVKSIKIPKNIPKPKPADTFESQAFTDEARGVFSKMSHPNVQAHFREVCPEIYEQYKKDPNNFDAFANLFREFLRKEWRKKELMADPTSEEGQRLLAEQIRLSNIDQAYEMTMEHNPEAYVSVHMLYVNMNINGCPVKAFVDSGAQVSVMSLDCAKRCNLEHLIDKRFTGTVRGVGGQQNFVGKIHMCKVQVEGHFFACHFDVLADRDMDVLFGLNILRRHQCSIDLKQNRLIFGDGISTPFLGEAEVEAYKMATGLSKNEEVAPDPEKVAEMVSIGIDQTEAEQLLKETVNDLSAAVQRALDKKAGPSTMEE